MFYGDAEKQPCFAAGGAERRKRKADKERIHQKRQDASSVTSSDEHDTTPSRTNRTCARRRCKRIVADGQAANTPCGHNYHPRCWELE